MEQTMTGGDVTGKEGVKQTGGGWVSGKKGEWREIL